MSLMRINHTSNEMRKLAAVINNLKNNYNNNFKEYDLKLLEADAANSFLEREKVAQDTENWDMLYEINKEKRAYTDPLDDLKSLAQFQNELMLVKHTALIESMIINLFRCLAYLAQNNEYIKKYFVENNSFSDSFEAVNKIAELTDKEINLKKSKFWDIYVTLKTIRNAIAHGEPLFVISYRRAMKFNKIIDMISIYSENDECEYTKSMYPSLLHPTHKDKSNWFCHLTDNLNGLAELNTKCLGFVEETKEIFLSYGNKKGISEHELYGCKPYNKAN